MTVETSERPCRRAAASPVVLTIALFAIGLAAVAAAEGQMPGQSIPDQPTIAIAQSDRGR
jgi:hypothetical protein